MEQKIIPKFSVLSSIHNLSSLIPDYLSHMGTVYSQIRWISWEKPPPGFIAVSVDFNCLGNPNPVGLGGLLRDENGQWLRGFSGHFGISNNLHVERATIFHGLEAVWNHGARKVICFSDCLDALRLVENDPRNVHHYVALLHDIYELKERSWELSFKHIL
ncbi:hypothetical protein RIF29_04205 [Crotalaria pallida]|uniref:RNase H type-1 domain-containing protein n=1 Tax=Crotalaria pallida TaxID=3830 RepID=A0AAN9P9X2_CROPI